MLIHIDTTYVKFESQARLGATDQSSRLWEENAVKMSRRDFWGLSSCCVFSLGYGKICDTRNSVLELSSPKK